jgi:hypothetical protein
MALSVAVHNHYMRIWIKEREKKRVSHTEREETGEPHPPTALAMRPSPLGCSSLCGDALSGEGLSYSTCHDSV